VYALTGGIHCGSVGLEGAPWNDVIALFGLSVTPTGAASAVIGSSMAAEKSRFFNILFSKKTSS
jgi:uncharacterized membrane protein YuzA (DUF378 family)